MPLLATFGCSFTSGEELANPVTEAWPNILAAKLGYTVHNYGLNGASNDYILRSLVESVSTHRLDAVVIMWTDLIRQEVVDEGGYWHWNPSNVEYGSRAEHAKYLTLNVNEQFSFEKYLQQIILAQALLEKENIPYLMVNAFNNYNYLRKYTSPLLNKVATEHFMLWPFGDFYHASFEYGYNPGNHPNAAAHQRIADLIHTNLKI